MNLLDAVNEYLRIRAEMEVRQQEHFAARTFSEIDAAEAALTVAERHEQRALETMQAAAEAESAINLARA